MIKLYREFSAAQQQPEQTCFRVGVDPDIIVSGDVCPDQAGQTRRRDLPVPFVTSSTGRQTIWEIKNPIQLHYPTFYVVFQTLKASSIKMNKAQIYNHRYIVNMK